MTNSNEDAEPNWRALEKLVAKIQRELAPDAEVLHNVKLRGRNSEVDRQIDVLVRQKVGQYEMCIVIDCKDYSSPVDVKGIEEFLGLVEDVAAQKGVMVCPSGFTSSAKKRAKRERIDLYRPVDTDPHKWQLKVGVPAVCDFRSARIALGIEFSEPFPFRIPMNFWDSTEVLSANGERLGTPLNMALNRWNLGEFPIEVGEHARVPIFRDEVIQVDNGYGQLVNVTLYCNLIVSTTRYKGHVPLSKVRGFLDEHTGELITNGFNVEGIDPIQVQNNWTKLDERAELPAGQLLLFTGLVCTKVDQP